MENPKGYLTTHVLDTSTGLPAEGIEIDLFRVQDRVREHILSSVTNSDGRTDNPILPAEKFEVGEYELIFKTGPYIERTSGPQDTPAFLSDIPILFGMNDKDAHYHVPLLLSPFGYSTYRGS